MCSRVPVHVLEPFVLESVNCSHGDLYHNIYFNCMSYGTTLIAVSILNGEFRLQITLKFIKVKWLHKGMMAPQGTE